MSNSVEFYKWGYGDQRITCPEIVFDKTNATYVCQSIPDAHIKDSIVINPFAGSSKFESYTWAPSTTFIGEEYYKLIKFTKQHEMTFHEVAITYSHSNIYESGVALTLKFIYESSGDWTYRPPTPSLSFRVKSTQFKLCDDVIFDGWRFSATNGPKEITIGIKEIYGTFNALDTFEEMTLKLVGDAFVQTKLDQSRPSPVNPVHPDRPN